MHGPSWDPRKNCATGSGQKFIMKFVSMNNYEHDTVVEQFLANAHARIGIQLFEVG